MSLPRFHVPGAAPGALLSLPEHSAHHAREVLRLRAGAQVRVFDGTGQEFRAVLETVSRAGVWARLHGLAEARAESPLHLILAVPPLKGDRMEMVIQKATELGVADIWPVVTVRTDAVGRPALHGARHERWEKVASSAAEQCGRAVVPRIAPTSTFDGLLSAPFPGARILFLERSALLDAPPPSPLAALALVGPAGGWEPREVERARAAGFAPAGLGPRILRAETAALVAVTLLQRAWGDL